MLGLHYLKSSPTTYVMQYKNGKLVAQGAGTNLLYFAPSSTIILVNQASQDVPFVFEQQTADFQDVTIQGNLTFRVIEPVKLAEQLDFSVDSRGRYISDDPDNLQERLVRLTQAETQTFARTRTLDQMLQAANELADHLRQEPTLAATAEAIGLIVESNVILSIRATPEMATAMQAAAREALLQKADEAVHQRRNTAIELERQIRENELQTERVVQEKRREVREAELQADVAIERGRSDLVELQSQNESKLAEVQIETTRLMLDAMREVDWRTIVAANGTTDSKQLIAMAFGELAENARKIGRLDITPDLLRQLIDDPQNERDSERS
ncbi:MAG: protein/band 7 family protein [Pirellulaceae bacterium]|nr:protein/band 7 family protein [Pirellulaceae bacterium]